MPSSIVEPYLKIQAELYNDSVEKVAGECRQNRDGLRVAGIARHEDRHGGRAALRRRPSCPTRVRSSPG